LLDTPVTLNEVRGTMPDYAPLASLRVTMFPQTDSSQKPTRRPRPAKSFPLLVSKPWKSVESS
jgi:hypothetical protein